MAKLKQDSVKESKNCMENVRNNEEEKNQVRNNFAVERLNDLATRFYTLRPQDTICRASFWRRITSANGGGMFAHSLMTTFEI